MNIIFMGTPDFAEASLKKLLDEHIKIDLVVTNPDKAKGRKLKLVETPVKKLAKENNIEVITPESLKDETVYNKIKSMKPDLIIVVAYGRLIPKNIIDLPKYGIINVHGSLLPKYRGAAPIQRAVLNGDKNTGITIMYIEEELDSGDMILKKETSILDEDTTETVFEKLKTLGADMLFDVVCDFKKQKSKLVGEKQDESKATYAKKISKEEAYIDFNKSKIEVKNLVRGMNGIFGAKAKFNNTSNEYKLFKVGEVDLDITNILSEKLKENGDVYVYEKGAAFKVNDGFLNILEIQAPNKKRMDIKTFLLGNTIK